MRTVTDMAWAISSLEWTDAYTTAASLEGWNLFDNSDYGLEIERIDDMFVPCPDGDGEPLFVSDDDAIAFVRQKAAEGSAMHTLAIAIHDERQGTRPAA